MSPVLRAVTVILLSAGALAACSDNNVGPTPEVASVTVTGVPASPLRAGSSVQLVATALNSTGSVVSNAQVQWSSSDTSIAKVSGGGLVTGVTAGQATITARSGQGEGTATLVVLVAKQIGTEGGVISAAAGAATLTVAQGVLPGPVEVTLGAATLPAGVPRMVARTGWTVGGGSAFPATLAVRYAAADVPPGMPEGSLQLYVLNPSTNGWLIVRGSSVNAATRTVTGPVFPGATYAVMSTGVAKVILSGAILEGALYTSRSGQLAAVALAANGDTAKGYKATWTTSNSASATVDSTGKVTAVGAGTVNVTAAIGDQSASTTIAVITRPTAAWSHTAEWSTYQGNNRHTGAINATLDPSAFEVGWTRTFTGRVTPAVTGGGRIYATIGSQLRALSSTTGADAWSYELGARDSFDPPAFGNGRVYTVTGGHSNSFLFGVDASSGTLVFRSAYSNQWSSWYAPVVDDQHVYMAGGYYGGMYSFNGASGAQRWFVNTNQYDAWTPALHQGKVYAYTGSYSPQLQVVDAASGTELFSIADPNFSWNGWSMYVAPVVGGYNNVLATQGGRLLSFDLVGRQIGWEINGGFAGPVTVHNGTIYVIKSGAVEARNEANGTLLWSWAPPSGAVGGALVAADNVVFASTEGATYAIDTAARRHTWSYPAGGNLAVTPDGRLLIVGQTKITAVNIR